MRRVIAHRSVVDELTERLVSAYDRLPIGNPMAEGTLVGPLIHRAPTTACRPRSPQAGAEGGKLVVGGDRVLADEAPDAYYVQAGDRAHRRADAGRRAGDLRPAALRAALRRPRRGDRAQQRGAAGALVEHLHLRPGRGRAVRLRRGLGLPASSTSTSVRRGPRSAARSAARRRPAAVASPGPTRGGPTCAGPPTPSTSPASCPSPRASTSPSERSSCARPRPTISSSPSSTCSAAGPSGMKLSALVTRASRPRVPAVDQGRDDALGDAAAAPGLVDHQDRGEVAAAAIAAPRGQRRQPAQVEHRRGRCRARARRAAARRLR